MNFPYSSTPVRKILPLTWQRIGDVVVFVERMMRGSQRNIFDELRRLILRGNLGRTIVLARNMSDTALSEAHIAGVDRMLLERWENPHEWARDADVNVSPWRSYHQQLVILNQPIRQRYRPDDETPWSYGTGEAVIEGVVNVRVQRRNPAHRYAKPMPGRHQNLVSCYDGPVRILSWDSERLNNPHTGEFLTNDELIFFVAPPVGEEPPYEEPDDETDPSLHSPIVWAKGILDPDREHGQRQSGLRQAYVFESVTAAYVVDRDRDDDDATEDEEDPDTVIDDDLIPGRGSVKFHEFGPSRDDNKQFPIKGFVQSEGKDVRNQIIIDTSGSPFSSTKLAGMLDATALPVDSRIFIQNSSTRDAAGRRVTSNDGCYFLIADSSFDDVAEECTLYLDREILPLPETLDDENPETLGRITLETWQPARKYTDGDGNLVDEIEYVWNTYEDESMPTGTPVDICRQQTRQMLKMPACAVTGLDLTPDVKV